jgi:MATE family multidrug resistance protein
MSSAQPSVWLIELRSLWRLAVPLVFVQTGHQLMGVVDTAVVGRLSASALAAVALANIVFYTFFVLAQGTVLGTDPYISQSLGAGDSLRARVMMWQGIWFAVAGAVVVVLLVATAPGLFSLFEIAPDVAGEATTYIRIRAVGALPSLLFVACQSYLQARMRTRVLVLAMIASNVLNLVATVLLVHGGQVLPEFCGPLTQIPAWGVSGSAVATVACCFLQLAFVVWAVSDLPEPGWDRRLRSFVWEKARGVLAVGIPVGLQLVAEVGVFALAGLLAGNIGSVPLAAHQVALTLTSVTFTICVAFGQAASVRVGRNVGAQDVLGVRVAGHVSLGSALAIMAIPMALFVVLPRPVARLLTDQADVVSATVGLLVVAAVFQLTDGLQAVGAGVLRGVGDTRVSLVANLVGHYVVGVPVAILCAFVFEMGVIGLWWGLAAGLSTVAIVLVMRCFWITRRPIDAL